MLDTKELIKHLKDGTQFIDVRETKNFTSGFLSGSIFLSLNHDFAACFTAFVNIGRPFLFIVDETSMRELPKSLEGFVEIDPATFVVYDGQRFSEAGLPIDYIVEVEADEFGMDLKFDEQAVPVDLRDTEHFMQEHIAGSISVPLIELADIARLASLADEGYLYFYDDSFEKALTACSLFKTQGLHGPRAVMGGWESIRKEQMIPFEKPQIPENNKEKKR